jgi:hypothetical protein
VGKVPVDLLVLVKQLISDFSCLLTVLLVPVLVVPELLVPVSLLLVPVSLLLVPVSLLLVPVSLLLLVLLGFAKAGELKAPAVTRIIAVRTTMIVNVVIFIYITTTHSSYMYIKSYLTMLTDRLKLDSLLIFEKTLGSSICNLLKMR